MLTPRLCVLLWIAASSMAAAQVANNLRFDVASVKPFADPVLIMSGVTTQPGGRFTAKAATLRDLVAYAYDVLNRQVEGTADWMTVERFDIEGKGAEDAAPPQFKAMLRSLLAERFALRTRKALKTVDAYALVVARGGLKLKPSEAAACDPPQPPCSGPVTLVGRMMAPNVLMSELAKSLSRIMDRPVVDRTEQTRHVAALKLDWVPDETQYADWGPGVWAKPNSDPRGPALATALQEQVGVRLEPTKAPIDVIVIDAAARPTPD
jgi:uncharacterized protein (TIGR03435 family)